jgi:hypothetical protein
MFRPLLKNAAQRFVRPPGVAVDPAALRLCDHAVVARGPFGTARKVLPEILFKLYTSYLEASAPEAAKNVNRSMLC